MAPRYTFLETALAPGDDRFSPLLRSSLAHRHRAAGARFGERDGWLVPTSYPDSGEERRVAVVDSSHAGKLEVKGGETPDDPAIADCVEVGPAHWVVLCRYPDLAALHGRLADHARLVVDRTSAWCALVLAGEAAAELLGALSHVASLPARGLAREDERAPRRRTVDDEPGVVGQPGGGPAGGDDLAIPDPLLAAAATHVA